jgi:hypothetical protein
MGRPRIFISVAKEDLRCRDLLVGQAQHSKTPFDFVDMSLAAPFDSKWKTNCRAKISGCHGFIALLSKNTWRATGARWEMKCAAEERIPGIGIQIHKDLHGARPPELKGRVIEWRWASIATFIRKVDSKRSFWDKLLS